MGGWTDGLWERTLGLLAPAALADVAALACPVPSSSVLSSWSTSSSSSSSSSYSSSVVGPSANWTLLRSYTPRIRMSGAKVTLHSPYGRHGALLVLIELQEDAWTLRVGGAAGRTHSYDSRRACAALWLLAAMGRLGRRCAGTSGGASRLAAGCCRCRRRRADGGGEGKSSDDDETRLRTGHVPFSPFQTQVTVMMRRVSATRGRNGAHFSCFASFI